ncbi:SHOCT domain-containing protein [Streptomyces sp. NPDC006990]|uniref:SHOCT domain-containing protein n=1 Tax=Streptomyces sp. NPDC006990 TaxID=3154481 RepID=UPI0034524F4A
MQTLAHWTGAGGPGPWILFFPLIWAALVAACVLLLRRTVLRGRRGPWQRRRYAAPGTESPLDLLDRRFAQGEIDEDEFWRRTSVLAESSRERHTERAGGGR